jgi:hypothetical protein
MLEVEVFLKFELIPSSHEGIVLVHVISASHGTYYESIFWDVKLWWIGTNVDPEGS